MRACVALLVLAQGFAGCRGSGAASMPSAPSIVSQTPVQSPRPASAGVKGLVIDSADRRLPGARVEVVDGPRAGLSAVADSLGEFYFAQPFDDTTVFRATHEGHIAAAVSWKSG